MLGCGVEQRRGKFGGAFFFSSRRRHTRWNCEWSSDVCSSDLNITMNLQLAGGSGLSDGSANFNAVFNGAMSTWNQYLNRVRFVAVTGSAGRGGDNDRLNQVFFDTTVYGRSFGQGQVAVTTSWVQLDNPAVRLEADVVFNSAVSWDSYRGGTRSNGVRDLRRIALHELGHVLGLDHPDTSGQRVNALMNSTVGDLDSLQ